MLAAILAFAPGLVWAQDRAEFSDVSGLSGTSVRFAGKTPPLDWLDNPERRELAEALWRVASKLGTEKNLDQRENARREVGLALVRLGDNRGQRLISRRDDWQTARSLETVRQILAGRLERAESLLTTFDSAHTFAPLLLADAYWFWRGDPTSARRLLLRAPRGETVPFLESERGVRLARIGEKALASRLFSRLESQLATRPLRQNDLLWLLSARLRGGFSNEAAAMPARFPALRREAIVVLANEGFFAEAEKVLNELPNLEAFDALLTAGFAQFAPRPLTEWTANQLERRWRALSAEEKTAKGRTNSLVRALANLRGVAASEAFIARELKGKIARGATAELQGMILSSPNLRKQVAPAKLQEWRDEKLRAEQNRAWQEEKRTKTLRGYEDADNLEAAWNLVAYAAIDAKNLKAARFALHRAEKFSRDAANPEDGLLTRMNLWRKIGDPAQAKKLEAHYRRLTGQPPTGRLIIEVYFQQDHGIFEGNETHIQQIANFTKILQISNVTQRALALANLAEIRFPLESVSLNPPQ